jgi:CDP-diacylglycerol--glycerol-3-phosphate 3-phosphatidyltransferase
MIDGFANHYFYAAGMVVIIWISDLLDGYFARKRNEISELGKIIDPLADKMTVISVSVVLLVQGLVPFWFFIIIILRDILIFSGGTYLKNKYNIVLQSNWAGKISVFIIGFTLFTAIIKAGFLNMYNFSSYHIEKLELYYDLLLLFSITISIYSLIIYLKRFKSVSAKKA